MSDLITLTAATKLIPGRPCVPTVWRWCRNGVMARNGERVRLQHWRCGGRLFTSQAALLDFFSRTAAQDLEHFDARAEARTGHVSERREKEIERANRELAEAGI